MQVAITKVKVRKILLKLEGHFNWETEGGEKVKPFRSESCYSIFSCKYIFEIQFFQLNKLSSRHNGGSQICSYNFVHV